jgi:hypothetical protein
MNTDAILAAYVMLDAAIPAFADHCYGDFMEHLRDFMIDHCDAADVEDAINAATAAALAKA